MNAAVAIRAAGLTVTARGENGETKTLLANVSFDVPAGSLIGVIGASGCGKSTLVKTLSGLIDPSSGEVLFAGHPIKELKRQFPLAVGYLSQFAAFHPELTVAENLDVAAALRLPPAVTNDVRKRWLDHIIKLSRLEPLLQQPYQTLSGGQMRRIALAEELIGDPAFLLLDELTSGLDAFSDREMMTWLQELAHHHGKTIVLVTHATYHLEACDAILLLHAGRQAYYGSYQDMLAAHGVSSAADLFGLYQGIGVDVPPPASQEPSAVAPQALKTARPPLGLRQFPILLARQATLFLRDRGQLWLHLGLAVTFPALVAVFAYKGLPQVRQLALTLESNIVKTLAEQLLYLKESFHAASLVSGLAMFQVILLTLIGANNGAREIAKEKAVMLKELRAGLSPTAYVMTKFLQVLLVSVIQAFWMAWFVKTLCGFPGSLFEQFAILFATTMAMSVTCLAISAGSPSPERASLLAIYLVGFQLPLSGAALALPEWLSVVCRPFIAAYWGWSGYLQTFHDTRYFDIVRQSTETWVASYGLAMTVLGCHILLALLAAIFLTAKARRCGSV